MATKSFIVIVLSAALWGCGATVGGGGGSDDDGAAPDAGSFGGGDDGGDDLGTPDAGLDDADDDGVEDLLDNCPTIANLDQTDTDSDQYGNACDCDPGDPELAAELVIQDSLSTDASKFAAPLGFTAGNWSYASGGYRQTRLVDDGTDAAFLTGDLPLEDVMIEVTAASTAIADFDASDLRQLMLVARADSTAASFAGVACGLEVVEGLAPTQRTSTLSFSGSPAAVATTVHQRTSRAAVIENEEFYMRMVLRDGTMTCTVVLDGVDQTVASASGLAEQTGRVGFLTRETRALFKNLRICSYRQ